MKTSPAHSSMVVVYRKCNTSNDLYCLRDWKTNQADLLWVAAVLDNVPFKFCIKHNLIFNKRVIHSFSLDTRYLFASIPGKALYDWEELCPSPFLSHSALGHLTTRIKGNWQNLSFRFEFPGDVCSIQALKARGAW